MSASLRHRITRSLVSTEAREDVYSMLGLMLANGKMLGESLASLQNAPGKGAGAQATRIMLESVTNQVENGQPFGAAMTEWVTPEEAALLDVGERAGDLDAACVSAIQMVRLRQELIGETISSCVKPAAMFLGICGLLWMVATQLGPMFESITKGEEASGAIGALIQVAKLAQAGGAYAGIAALFLLVWTFYQLPRLTGMWRVRMERIPTWTGYGVIWQVYKGVQGALWLQNLVTLGRAGMKREVALGVLNGSSTPYIRERNEAVLRGLSAGLGLGSCLNDCGLEFPSERAIHLLQKIDEMAGVDDALADFSSRWIARVKRELKRSMAVLSAIAMLSAAVMVMTLVAAMAEIQDTVEVQTDQYS